MAFVIKVEFEGILRRLSYNAEGTENLSFAKLEGRVRDLFKLSNAAQLKITYKDKEDDVVTMTNDQELKDACVIQKLNPLRLMVVVLPTETGGNDMAAVDAAQAKPESVEKPTIPETDVKNIVECYAPVFEGICPPSQIPEVMDDIVKKVSAQVSAVSVTQSGNSTDTVNPSTETSLLTPLDWLRNLPTPNVSSELEKQDLAPVVAPTESSPVSSSAKSTEVVHKGVTCDICHMSPITGTRYKAIKKANYDVCGRCFDRSGRADDFSRIEQPLSRPVWETNSVRMVLLSPANANGPTDSCSSPKAVKRVGAPRGGRCKPMKSR